MNEFSIVSYNIDGLPNQLDLNTLPWYLKPVSWIYKLFKGTTIVSINDNPDRDINTYKIGCYISDNSFDIAGVQEDFNYHETLTSTLNDKYDVSTYTGDLDLSKIGKKIHFHWNRWPSYNIDGLCAFTKKDRVKVLSEERIAWNKCYGYVSHANDALMDKGFRYLQVLIDDKVAIDVYLLHMDADYYNPETCPDVSGDIEARKSQLQQLTDFIKEHDNKRPVIIMGDTNSTYKFKWDTENLQNYLLNAMPVNMSIKDAYIEVGKESGEDVDKIFYINNSYAEYKITPTFCQMDRNAPFSDHYSLTAKFEYTQA